MEEILVGLGRRLKALRKAKDLRQKDMAELMGITEQNYQRYEYGKINIPATTLVFFANFYGVSADYLLGLEGTALPPKPSPFQGEGGTAKP